jgi:two-component system sensor histidine kinase BaeS
MSHARSGARSRTPRRSARRTVAEADRYLQASEAMAAALRRVSQHASALTRQGIDREEFVAALGHDLLQPLTALRTASRLLAQLSGRHEAADAAQLLQCAVRVERLVDLMSRLVDRVISAAELDLAPIRIDRAFTDLSAVARAVAEILGPEAEKRGVVVDVEPAPSPVMAYCDATWIGDVLVNLVTNGIRHSPPGGIVRISIEPFGGEVRCAVEDDGLGVSPAMRARLFERFARQGEQPGRAGLGLYIARRILELHGGRIWLAEATRGARFVFQLASEAPGATAQPVAVPHVA